MIMIFVDTNYILVLFLYLCKMKKIYYFLFLCFTSIFYAQTDIEEQIFEVKSKMDKFNVFMNFQTSFDAHFNEKEESNVHFQGVMSRVEVRGNLNEKLFYRVRYRLNRSAEQTFQDNLSGAADMALVGYRFDDKWSATFGKMGQNWGGFEFDLNPMNIYDYSDYVYNIDAFLTGLMVYYRHNDQHDFSLNLNNISIKKMEERYGKAEESFLPLSSVFTWAGKFNDNKIQTRWTLAYNQQRKGKSSKMLILGNKFFFPRWNFFVDYSFAQEDLDRLGYASAYAENSAVERPRFWENVWYHSVVSRLEYKIKENWIYSVQGAFETADVRQLSSGFQNNKRRGFAFFTGVEWLPFPNERMSVYANYSGRWYDFKKNEMDYATHRFSLGLMYRIKAF